MSGRKASEVPRWLAHVAERFADWRRSHEPGTRVPESLWAVAVKLATKCGVSRTAVALKLNYGGLKRRVEGRALEARPRRASSPMPAFVELPGPMLASPAECVIECENAAGAKLRVHLKGGHVLDLLALSGSFWNLQR
jgi:hypothetical protein